ncbi:MAG: hypothetical protein ACRD0D_03390, partial [Acidimicrobiales bacterium]
MPGPHRRGEHGEHGIAMVTAILISAVVLVFMVAALGLAVHSTSSSGADRSRTQAVHAAEAGVHRTISQISTLGATGLPCGTVSGTVNTAPQGSYAATITYFSTYPPVAGTEVDCTLWGSTPPAVPPRGATIRSQGTARADGALARTMQTQVRFADPIFGPFSNAAIYSASDLTLPNNLTVQGDSSADADIYIDGNLVCQNNITVNGSVYPQGSATLGNTCKIDRDLWALDAITMDQSSRVVRNATSSTSSISLNSSSRVDGNATAGTTCAGCSGRVGGTVTVSSPQGPPPSIAPALDYDAA